VGLDLKVKLFIGKYRGECKKLPFFISFLAMLILDYDGRILNKKLMLVTVIKSALLTLRQAQGERIFLSSM
jgi:hypothetical protein